MYPLNAKVEKVDILNHFDNYIKEDPEIKELLQELVFKIYFYRNTNDLSLTLKHIKSDIIRLENDERYENCRMLKDILDNFE